jgi:hypothetical protein
MITIAEEPAAFPWGTTGETVGETVQPETVTSEEGV